MRERAAALTIRAPPRGARIVARPEFPPLAVARIAVAAAVVVVADEAPDVVIRHVLRVVDLAALPPRQPAVGLGSRFHARDLPLLPHQRAKFRPRQPARGQAVSDPLLL